MLKFYSDDGHGWLAVKIQMLHDLGIAHKITRYSYTRGQTAYLEEDKDAQTFLNACTVKPEIKHINHNGRSPIRSYDSYVPT
jgi:hypothetical protein